MRHNGAILGVAVMALAITGCAEQEAITEAELQRPVEVEPVTTDNLEDDAATDSTDDATTEDAASDKEDKATELVLEPVTFSETLNIVRPGLGCSFIGGDDASLLFATGEDGADQPIQAAVKMNGGIIPLLGRGGYSALEAGPTLTSEALEVTIQRGEGEGEKVGVETMEWPATLTIAQDEGGSASYEGRYSCGA